MQLEFSFFTPYHRLLDLVTDVNDVHPCTVENPALWYAFCRLTNRMSDTPAVWSQRDIVTWANDKIRKAQGEK
jgi:hypothetical protein